MSQRARNYPPDNYNTPSFPSINWQLRDLTDDHRWSLFHISDIWRFTVLWTTIIYAVVHLGAAAITIAMHTNKRGSLTYIWAVPLLYLIVSGVQALVAGSVVGLILGAVYNAGFFSMSTWIPLLWGVINVLVLIIASFTIQGGL
ncbi:integral membrane protein [Colletotrichum incanum]|nr:integral membrane protein [Colletotrichum incanum]